MRWVCLVAAVLGLGACAAPRTVAPDDFSLSITILPSGAEPESRPDALAPAWYVLDPDDSLRIGLGERHADSRVPGMVRRLSRAQVGEVWSMAEADGLNARDAGRASPDRPGAVGPGSIAIVSIAANQRRRTYTVDASDPKAEAVARLVDHLRAIGWVHPGT